MLLRATFIMAAIMAAVPASAQTTNQFPLQFDFLNPGARSLALGSAFTGLADDATAAFTNPAGLLQLGRPEISFEGRFRGLDTRFLQAGRISGTLQNIGEDRIAGPVYADDQDRGFGASFISFIYPTRRWAVAAYRHETSRIENTFLYRGVFERGIFAGVTNDRFRDLPLSGARNISIDNYGASLAVRLGNTVTVGGGVSLFQFDLDAEFQRFGLIDTFEGPDFNRAVASGTQTGDDTGAGFSAGLQVRVIPQVQVGAVYRRAPEFEFTQADIIPNAPSVERTGQFQVPDTIGLGVAIRPNDSVVIAADYVRVSYEDLKEDFINLQALGAVGPDRLELKDGSEFHAGVEWVLTNLRFTPALRGGLWFDPDHTVRYLSNGNGDQLDTRFRAILPGGDDVWHYTFGGGAAFSRVFEVNAAADISKRSSYASASVIVRFF